MDLRLRFADLEQSCIGVARNKSHGRERGGRRDGGGMGILPMYV